MFTLNEELRTTTLEEARQKYLESKLYLYKSMLGAYLRDSGKL